MIINITKLIDRYIGPVIILLLSILFYPIRNLNKNKETPKRPIKILLVKLWALGDSVLTLTLIDEIKKKYPNSEIIVLARKRNEVIYKNNSNIKNVIRLKDIILKFQGFDFTFDTEPYLNISALISRYTGKHTIGFDHNIRAIMYDKKVKFKMQHMVDNYLSMLDLKPGYKKSLAKVFTSSKDDKYVSKFLTKYNIKKIACLTIGAAETATKMRMWPIENYAKIAEFLILKKYTIFFIGSAKERNIIERCQKMIKYKTYNSSEIFNLSQAISLITIADLMISNDTGPMHIAAAQGVMTIGLFGANTPILWGAYGKENISLYHKHPKSPCIDNKNGTINPDAINIDFMSKISVDEVKKAVLKMI